MLKTFYYQLMHIMLKNTELLKQSKITLQHVSVLSTASSGITTPRFKTYKNTKLQK